MQLLPWGKTFQYVSIHFFWNGVHISNTQLGCQLYKSCKQIGHLHFATMYLGQSPGCQPFVSHFYITSGFNHDSRSLQFFFLALTGSGMPVTVTAVDGDKVLTISTFSGWRSSWAVYVIPFTQLYRSWECCEKGVYTLLNEGRCFQNIRAKRKTHLQRL